VGTMVYTIDNSAAKKLASSMQKSSQKSPPSGQHRTKKGAATFDKMIQAGIASIAKRGFHNTSTNQIAKEAGVTWGTLQHQFGDKARMLEAILEFCFNEQMLQLAQSSTTREPLQQRIDSTVEAIWRNQQTASSRAMQEILSGVQGDTKLSKRFSPTLKKLRDLYNEQWQQLFADVELSNDKMEAVKELTFGTLQGLSFDVTVRSSEKSIQAAKELLKKAILAIFHGNL